MASRWHCPNGHDGDGPLPFPSCPACGLPIEWRKAKTPEPEGTLVGPAPATAHEPTMQRPEATPPLHHAEPSPSVDETLRKPDTAPIGPAAPTAHNETLQKPSTHVTQTATVAADSEIPTGYELLGILGRGGMGVVYKARQVGLNRLVALKMILSGGHASAEELARFRIEAEAVARLQHPNIVQVFDIGNRDGRPYFSLEYCDGGSLQQQLDGTPMEPRKAAVLLETLARAIDFAHKSGIVHRDLKPANVLLTADGTPKVTDFGLAKRLEDDQGQTGTEAVLGTPTYMAPEQASGKTRAVGPAADIYSLGAVFYDLLTGRPPFRGTTALDTLQLVQTAEPIPPARIQPKVTPDLQTICLKCLEKEPAKRYATAGDLAADLRRYLEGRPIQARPTTRVERAWKWARRHPAAAAAAALAVLAPLTITALSVAFAVRLEQKNQELSSANDTLESQAEMLELQNTKLETGRVALESTNRDLSDKQKELERANAGLERRERDLVKALAEVTSAQADAQRTFLTALDSARELTELTKRELSKPGSELLKQALLRKAVAMCLTFTERPGDLPLAQLRAARAHKTSADLEEILGNLKESVRHYEQGIALYKKLLQRGEEARLPGVDYQKELLETEMRYWGVLEAIDPPKAERVMATVDREIQALGDRRESADYRHLVGRWLVNRAVGQQLRDRPEKAREDYDRAMAEVGKSGTGPDVQLELALIRIKRATLLTADRDRLVKKVGATSPAGDNLALAGKDCEEAIQVLSRRLRDTEDATLAELLAQGLKTQGLVQELQKRNDLARKAYERAVDLFAGLLDQAPENVEYRHHLAVAQGDLGSHLIRLSKAKEGRKDLDAGRAALVKLVEKYPDTPAYRLDLARLNTAEGIALSNSGDVPRAERPLSDAYRLMEKLREELPHRADLRDYYLIVTRNLIYCHDFLARQAELREYHPLATRHVTRLVELRRNYEKAVPPLGPAAPLARRLARFWERLTIRAELARTLASRAELLAERGDHDAAARCVAEMRPLLAADWPGWLNAAALLSRCARLAGDNGSLARSYGRQALDILERLAAEPPAGMARTLDGNDFEPLRRLFPGEVSRVAQSLKR